MLIELLIFFIIGAIFFYRWVTKNYDHFKKRNIPYEKPTFLVGSGKDFFLRRKNILEVICDLYNRHNGIVYGVFDNRDPVLLLRDPELIKHVMIKDFDHFVNRSRMFGANNDNLLSLSLATMLDDKWRDMRSTLSPAFTGSKMRQMFKLILQTVDEAMGYLKKQQPSTETDNQEGFELDVKDFTTRLTNDIIASTAFGLQVNSFRDKDNEFYVKAKKALTFSKWQVIVMILLMMFPKLTQKLGINLFDKNFTKYFMSLVLDSMKYRKENNIHRPDMINLLMEARGMIPTDIKKTHYREWTDEEMVAQCFIFFIAGFETSAVLMTFAAHEVMENPQVQEKLYSEIKEVDDALQGAAATYEDIQKLTYMDMVVSEVLRKWPIAIQADRLCNKDFVYESPEGERVEIKKDDHVRISICGLHRDAKYFENPEVFDPERFSDENKSNILTGTYLPFGLGPRNCIANRFAMLEIKAFLYYFLRDYRLEASPKTPVPLELDKKSFQLKPKNGFWLRLMPRN